MSLKPNFYMALKELIGEEADVKLGGGGGDGPLSEIIFNDETEKPTDEEVNIKLASMISDWDAQEYARNRASAYPSTGDQLDMMYKDTKNSTTTHAAAVEAVKTKWPKDNSGPV